MQGSGEVRIQEQHTGDKKALSAGAEPDRYFTLSLIGYGTLPIKSFDAMKMFWAQVFMVDFVLVMSILYRSEWGIK